MNRKVVFLLSLILVSSNGLADIYKATRWIDHEGKSIVVYSDNHDLSNGEQFNYLYNNVITKFKKAKPERRLLILTECSAATWSGTQLRKLYSEEEKELADKNFLNSFRKLFFKRFKRYLKKQNIDIVNVETREIFDVLTNIYNRPNFSESSELINYISNKTLRDILGTVFGHVSEYAKNPLDYPLNDLFNTALKTFEEELEELVGILVKLGFTREFINEFPFLEFKGLLRSRNDQDLFYDMIESFPLRFPRVLDITLLKNIFSSDPDQDLAIFAGGLHVVNLEGLFDSLGYEKINEMHAFRLTGEPLVSTFEDWNAFVRGEIPDINPISTEVFDWILE